jgi:hypothetical protein
VQTVPQALPVFKVHQDHKVKLVVHLALPVLQVRLVLMVHLVQLVFRVRPVSVSTELRVCRVLMVLLVQLVFRVRPVWLVHLVLMGQLVLVLMVRLALLELLVLPVQLAFKEHLDQ